MYNDFGDDGGPAAKELAPKMIGIQDFLTSKLGDGAPKIDVRYFVAASIFLKGLGGFLFVFGSSLGAYFLLYNLAYMTPLLFDFYNYNFGEPKFWALLQEFSQYIAYFGALLFFIGMKNSLPRKQIKKKTPKAKTN